jgi:hypothetical protein
MHHLYQLLNTQCSMHDHHFLHDQIAVNAFVQTKKPCEIHTFTSVHASTQSMALFSQQDNMVVLTINPF